jgi:sugar lactone lactonase YvrE
VRAAGQEREVLVRGLTFGEGPRWHDGALHLSDMFAPAVIRVEGDGLPEVVATHTGPVSGLGWLPDGRLLVVAMDGELLRLESGGLVRHADLRAHAAYGVNDMIVHPGGWAYVGQFGYDRHAGGRAVGSALLRVDADGAVSEAAPDLMVANGMALMPDGRTLLVAESAGMRISAFSVDAAGVLSGRRVYAQLPAGHAPDGMCLDVEGAVWVAAVTKDCFLRLAEGGAELDRITMEPGRRAVACVLGGADRRTLHLLTAETFGEPEASRATSSAQVEVVRVDVPGAGLP